MTREQKEFYEQVIQPRLVELQSRGLLPNDLNEVSSYMFEKKANEYNRKRYRRNGKR